jgi:hypothetical protein
LEQRERITRKKKKKRLKGKGKKRITTEKEMMNEERDGFDRAASHEASLQLTDQKIIL